MRRHFQQTLLLPWALPAFRIYYSFNEYVYSFAEIIIFQIYNSIGCVI